MQFVGIKQNLSKGCITERQRTAFLNPCGSRLGGGNVNLVLAGGADDISERAHDVFFLKHLDESIVIFLRYQVTAVGINAFLQNIGNLLEVGSESLEHAVLILIRGTAALYRRVSSRRANGSTWL